MAMVDSMVEDVAGRFGLGPQAASLMREVALLITNSPSGIGGFINKFKSAGLSSQVASWLGRTDGAALTAPQVETALGNAALGGIASRLGLGGSAVATAIGYVVPKLIGQLTPGGIIPSGIRPRFQRSWAHPYKR
jgi:OmpA-OmpF porin, OOP family